MSHLDKAGSGSVEALDFNAVVDVVESGVGPITAADIDSLAASNGDVLTADGAGNAAWEASAGGVPTSRTLTAGAALTGGGDLSANRTFDVAVDGSTIEVNADALRVKALGITDSQVAAANKDGLVGTPSMRTLGTGAQQALPGDTVIPSAPSFATPAVALGAAAVAGSAGTVIRSDSTIVAFDATAPTTQAFADAAVVGTAAVAARRDHKHAMPAAPTSVSGNAGTATALATSRNIDGQGFDGTANITVIAPGTHAATSKNPPVDADEIPLVDSAASNVLKKLTWANLKAAVKAYTDTLYPSGSGSSTGTNTGDQTVPAFATNAVVLGTAAAAGAASTVMRSNDTIAAFDATSPTTQAFGDSAAVGVATVAARRDHKHAMPAAPTAASVGADPAGSSAAAVVTAEAYSDGALATHAVDTTSVHGIVDTSALVLTTDTRLTYTRPDQYITTVDLTIPDGSILTVQEFYELGPTQVTEVAATNGVLQVDNDVYARVFGIGIDASGGYLEIALT